MKKKKYELQTFEACGTTRKGWIIIYMLSSTKNLQPLSNLLPLGAVHGYLHENSKKTALLSALLGARSTCFTRNSFGT